MKRNLSVKGIPEWLPEQKSIENDWIRSIASTYEKHGYNPIETGAFEQLDVLSAKGEIDKEIYFVSNRHSQSADKYGLHYDLTVPFARYVAQNYNSLVFPFKRYQIQKVWRGERPQRGRYREFYQCDIDVIDNETLHSFYDAEVLLAGDLALEGLNIPKYQIGISNRKIYEGYLVGIGLEEGIPILRVIDKIDKIGVEGVSKILRDDFSIPQSKIEKALKLSSIKSDDLGFVDNIKSLNVSSPLLEAGVEELKETFSMLLEFKRKNFLIDLSFVRGFDYYTGVIFEGKFIDDPTYGSICSGGRYENLTGQYIKKKLPGVGFSIGLTRIFAKLKEENKLNPITKKIDNSIILRTNENDLNKVNQLARELRKRKYVVEVYPELKKIDKLFKYADKKGFKWVWIESKEQPGKYEVKNMITGEQELADPSVWIPK